jgi:hypothetical protein
VRLQALSEWIIVAAGTDKGSIPHNGTGVFCLALSALWRGFRGSDIPGDFALEILSPKCGGFEWIADTRKLGEIRNDKSAMLPESDTE